MYTEEAKKTNCRNCTKSKDWKLHKPNHYYGVCTFRAQVIFQSPHGFCYHTYNKSKQASVVSLDFCEYFNPKELNEKTI